MIYLVRNIFFLHGNQSLDFFRSSKSSATFDHAASGEIDLDYTEGSALVHHGSY
jgi:hypothetical protein